MVVLATVLARTHAGVANEVTLLLKVLKAPWFVPERAFSVLAVRVNIAPNFIVCASRIMV